MDSSNKNQPPIITVGSGNLEYILICEGEIKLGKKHLIQPSELIGGSGVNYTMRLMAAGENVFPIPLIGNDQSGLKIREKITNKAITYGMPEKSIQFISTADFLIEGLCTPRATVVIHEGRRTIFSETVTQPKPVKEHVLNRLETVFRDHPDLTGSIMIGHITQDHNDRLPGEITRSIIDANADQAFLFANFGAGQLRHGIDFWEDDLKRVDLVQLNLGEIRQLFEHDHKDISLQAILKWLRNRSISAVITLSRFGAIGTFGDGNDGIILAWPLQTGKPADPTGAGDAFAAGMVASLKGNKNFSFDELKAAVATGRLWASYACTTIGASGKCPTIKDLAEFASKHTAPAKKDIEVTSSVNAERILDLFDKAY
jgi:sugar/nucleoside kinase (ribokinase family)